MAKTTAIGSCLENYLSTATGLPFIKFPNTEYNPPTDSTFIVARVIHTSRRRASLGLGQPKRSQGIFTIDIFTPENLGPGAGSDLADLVLTRFDLDTSITFGGVSVSIDYAEVNMEYEKTPFYCTPVVVAWYAYTD